jgi:hypothetical protein
MNSSGDIISHAVLSRIFSITILQDRSEDIQFAAAVRAVLQVEIKSALETLAHLSRPGLWCAPFASHSAGGAVRAGGCGSCGTACASSFALRTITR